MPLGLADVEPRPRRLGCEDDGRHRQRRPGDERAGPALRDSEQQLIALEKAIISEEGSVRKGGLTTTEETIALRRIDRLEKQRANLDQELDKQVLDAELGVLPLDDITLVKMKKEKLHAKDRLTRILENSRAPA